jgi:hypothetical protein
MNIILKKITLIQYQYQLLIVLKVVVAFVTGSIGDRLKIKNLNGLKIKLWKVGA